MVVYNFFFNARFLFILETLLYISCFVKIPTRFSIKEVSRQTTASSKLFVFSNDNKWTSSLSTDPDLNIATEDIVTKLFSELGSKSLSYDIAIFFVSSIYEASAYSYDIIFNTISSKFPNLKYILGCTTGCPIGIKEIVIIPFLFDNNSIFRSIWGACRGRSKSQYKCNVIIVARVNFR